MINESDKIEPGEMKFLEVAPPPLVAGYYELKMEQDIAIPASSNTSGAATSFANSEINFYVDAPRFSLDPAEIYSVYPDAGSKGSYYKSLPHIVLNRKTLPWERVVNAQSGTAPWLALLVFDEDEIKQYDIAIRPISLTDLFNKDDKATILIPDVKLAVWEAEEQKLPPEQAPKYNVTDIPMAIFKEVAPFENELGYLAHARQVDSGNKEIAGINAKGWFSVLIANRIPTRGKNNFVYLVSLEGHNMKENFLSSDSNSNKKIRLVVLHSWIFNAEGPDFEELVTDLNKNVGMLKIDTGAKPIDNDTIKTAVNFGFTPMNIRFRNGKKDIAWYRGPLVPIYNPTPAVYEYFNADAALHYDRESNMFDVSYSAAWQLGRLLAFQDNNYMKAVKNWKSDYVKSWRVLKTNEMIKTKFPDMILPGEKKKNELATHPEKNVELLDVLHKVESDEIMRNFILELWNQKLSN